LLPANVDALVKSNGIPPTPGDAQLG